VIQIVIPNVPRLVPRILCRRTLCRQTPDLGSLTCLFIKKKTFTQSRITY
jgi:hypothetical protein